MRVENLSEFRKERAQREFQKEMETSEFILDMWYEATDKERYLPRELAIKLIEQIMLDHGIRPQEFTE